MDEALSDSPGRACVITFAEELVPSPGITSIIVEHPTKEGPCGARGIGELVSIPTAPAMINAMDHACGVRVRNLPVDQDWLARQLAAKPRGGK